MKNSVRLSYVHLAGRDSCTPAFFAKWENHRISLIILLLFVFFTVSIGKYDLTGCLVFAAFPLFLITASSLPALLILKRILILSPFIIIMATANPIIDRTPFIKLYSVTISSGMISGAVIIIKSVVTISSVIAFTFCIPFYRICEVLRELHVPDIFVTQLALLYRYSFLLVEEAMAMQKARNLRSFGKKGKDVFTTSKLIGTLLLRTNDKAERIYRGMIARGFNGKLSGKKKNPVRPGEILLIISAFFTFAFLRLIF
ncbi:MAG: cobalt ECF transporter T component CbiQ [Fibrobacter sp.]|nr:cobalt ECF transporter T component CbiQ [Fibrobacter sp.]